MSKPPLLAYLLRVKQLADLLSISKSSVWSKVNSRSRYFDPSFPQPFKIGRATFFKSDEAIAYVDEKIRACRADADTEKTSVAP